jgi:putative ABC transport system permease protein
MRIFNSPWWRAPFQLFRRPGVAISLVAATFVATLPVAAAPVFLGTTQSATLHDQVADNCPSTSGVAANSDFYQGDNVYGQGPTDPDKQAAAVATAFATAPNLTPMQATFYHVREFVTGMPKDDPATHPWFITVMSRDGFQNHIQVLEKADAPVKLGVYVPDDLAKAWKAHVGDAIPIGSNGQVVTATIAAIYKNMLVGHLPAYWCSVKPIFQGNYFADSGQPSLILTDQDTALTIMKQTGVDVSAMYESALRNPAPSPDETKVSIAGIRSLQAKFAKAATGDQTAPISLRTSLPLFNTRATLVGHVLTPPIYAVSIAGVLVGLLVLGASALLWTRRREHELMVLAIRGSSPLALGVKAVLETLPAIVVGSVLGALAARWVVLTVGPAHSISADALRRAVASSAVVALVALLVVLFVAVRRSARLTDFTTHLHGRSRLAAVPWELLLLVAAFPLWTQMGGTLINNGGDDTNPGGVVVQLPPRTLVVPILVIVGVSIFAGRLFAAYLSRRGLKRAPKGHARYLAWRRLGREPIVSATLLAIAAVPAAVAGFGAMAAQSVQTTIQTKALASVGADVVVTVSGNATVTPAMRKHGSATLVRRSDGVRMNGLVASLLGVDPEQFKKIATVGSNLAGPAYEDTLDKMAHRTPGEVTVLASAPLDGGTQEIDSVEGKLKVNVVLVPRLPAQYSGYPIIIANVKDVPPDFFAGSKTQIWANTADPDGFTAAVRATPNVDLTGANVARDSYAGTLFQPITYNFEYFVAIALLTGVVVAVGLLLYLESRTVAHRRAYILLRRMGLRPRTHRAALLWELCGALGVGLIVAAATVAALGFSLKGSFDVNPNNAPGTVLAVPAPTLIAIIGCVAVTAIGAALFGHARVARAKPAEVLRDAV